MNAMDGVKPQIIGNDFSKEMHPLVRHPAGSLCFSLFSGAAQLAFGSDSPRTISENNSDVRWLYRERKRQRLLGMSSVFYDVLNNMVINACIKPNNTSERLCAISHLEYANKNDLFIYDRGYVGFEFLQYHMQHELTFCVRAKTKGDNTVKAFIKSNKKEEIILLSPNKKFKKSN